MRKTVIITLTLIFSVSFIGITIAAEKKKAVKKAQQPAVEVKKEEPAVEEAQKKKEEEERAAALAKKREAQQKAQQTLSAKTWTIHLTSLAQKTTETDTLTFSEGKISSKSLSEKGFPTTNYTLTLQEDGTIVWETMQTAENAVAFWRGELRGDIMQGLLNKQPKEGQVEEFAFSTVAPKIEKVEPPAAVEPEKPKAEELQPEPPKAPAPEPAKKGKKQPPAKKK